MAEGKATHEWNFWASTMALTANINRDPKKTKPFSHEDFHPFLAAKKKARRGINGMKDFIAAMKGQCKRNRFAR